jgi:hypothetical protein
MKQLLCVLNSDSLNRNGQRFTVRQLISALWREHDVGMPLLISHDFQRAIGWQYPFAIHFEPGLTRLSGLGLMVDNKEESQQLSDALVSYVAEIAAHRDTEIVELRAFLGNHLTGNEKILCAKESLALIDSGLCTRVFPEVFQHVDKDGLVPLKQLDPIGPGVFRIGNLTLFAHNFFRRSFSRMNTLNSPFLERIQNITDDNVSVRIAVDPDVVGLASAYSGYQELEYWWGPKFSDNLSDIPVGVSHHEAEETDRIFHGISGSQFWWQSRDGKHIFEAEELRNIPTSIGEGARYGCRYVHSIVDEKSSRIDHLDGAVRVYPEEKMIERLELGISQAGKHTEYTKLWRLDGIVPISLWKSLVSDYFRDNRLIGEYFGATEEFEYAFSSERDSQIQKLVPYSMSAGDGVRIALSFHDYKNEVQAERSVVSLDSFTLEAGDVRYVESWTLEFEKTLSRMGESLFISDEIQFLTCKDFYINFPLIVHKKDSRPEIVPKTIEAFRLLIRALRAKGYDQVASYSIAFALDDKETRISVLGHINDLEGWLSEPLSVPPASREGLFAWTERVAEYLRLKYPEASNKPSLAETLMPSGVLLIRRQSLAENIDVQYEQTDRGLMYGLQIPDNEQSLRECVEKGEIIPATAFLKVESKCTKCQQAYRSCSCSKMLDGGVTEEIIEAKFIRPFWTDRPIYRMTAQS